ncbi:hypothetical protein DVH24_010930 [Malus domestica]|uniref:Uncharacterized protein n=1 Tax=Malus domestica TaxID=3750 RepID=A0A498JTV6_MALDO|nr:hypothetical protein DVH24_010930 [Malus domestica]
MGVGVTLEAMTKGSDQRYLGGIQLKLKIAQGVVGAVADHFADLVRTGAAQVEGGVHGLVSYEKKSF